MDYNEFEHPETNINPNRKYSKEIEFVVKNLNHMANAAGRYDRSVQLPIAINIVSTLQSEKSELVEMLEEFIEWANIKDGSPSQYLRDKAKQLLTKHNG